MIDCNKRLVEVNVVLNHLSDSDYNKIPKEIIQVIKDNMDKEYIWEYDETKELKDQELSRDTIAFLSYINMEYLLNDKQREYIQNLYDINEKQKLKEEYSNDNKYNYSKLFKRNDEKEKIDPMDNVEQASLVVYEERFFKKIVNKIKRIFGRIV